MNALHNNFFNGEIKHFKDLRYSFVVNQLSSFLKAQVQCLVKHTNFCNTLSQLQILKTYLLGDF